MGNESSEFGEEGGVTSALNTFFDRAEQAVDNKWVNLGIAAIGIAGGAYMSLYHGDIKFVALSVAPALPFALRAIDGFFKGDGL